MTFFSIRNKKIIFTIPFSMFLSFLGALGITLFLFVIAPGSIQEFMKNIVAYPSLFFLNFIPAWLLILLVWFLTNQCIFSITASGIFLALLGIANRLKISLRQDPLMPTDLTLAREAITILHTFDKSFLLLILGILSAMVIAIVLSILFFRSEKLKPLYRTIGSVAVIILSIGCNHPLYASETLYDKYPVDGNIYFQVNHYNSKGLVYSFLHSFNTLQVKKPEGYSVGEMSGLESASTAVDPSVPKPHIIMIMGEAFSDISINKNLDYTGYIDPLANFKALCQRKNAISGHIVVPGFGGGTSNTEYDVLTACPTRYLENTLPSYSFVRKDFDALPRRLEQIGYDTLAIHPGYSWFYNRLNVYNSFGFDNFITLDSFDPQTQSKGGYISEAVTMDTIIKTFDEHIAKSDNPLFSFTVTIQNHGPYENKYNETQKNFNTSVELTSEEKNMLYNYFNGLKDVDHEIGRLVDYISNSKEPIVLVYFGDHLPGFSNGMDFFDKLDYDIDINGTLEQQMRVYETPYVIWENDAAAKSAPFSKDTTKINPNNSKIISSNYLGAMLVELMGMDGLSPLYDYANTLRKDLPVSANEIFLDTQGNYFNKQTKSQAEKIQLLKYWQYYKLFDETIQSTQ